MSKFRGMVLQQPAFRWTDALPAGNGQIGAMVYGHICHELILLNHDSLWMRTDKLAMPDISHHMPELRRLLFAGEYAQANKFLDTKLSEAGYKHPGVDPYHPAGDLHITMHTDHPFTEYRRELDFTTGVVSVHWRDGDVTGTRETFVSRADNVVVVRIRMSRPGQTRCRLRLTQHNTGTGDHAKMSDVPVTFENGANNHQLTLTGTYHRGGQFGCIASITHTSGEAKIDKDAITVENADEVVVRLKLFANEPVQPAIARLTQELQALSTSYDQLLSRHVELHRAIFERAGIELADTSDAQRISNEQAMLDAYSTAEIPLRMIQQMTDYGRYLLISSSSPGGWPANLQGIWNGDYTPEWASDIHNDENIQMNYWQSLPGDLRETTLPYFEYFESCLDDYRENARKIFGCRGIFVPIAQSTHGMAHPGAWLNWTAGAGWIAQLFYDYFLFTGDHDFLVKRAVPFMREVAMFYADFIVTDDRGRLTFMPSLSPENPPNTDKPSPRSIICINATMDIAVAREVWSNLCTACDLLGIEDESVGRWRSLLAKLPEYEINSDGAIREWLWPGLYDNYHHRHQSHLYPVFPGFEITKDENPRLFEACRVAVEKRLVIGLTSQTGWSMAHMANIYARLGEGDRALECLEILIRHTTGVNLFTYHNDWRGQGASTFWGHQSWPPFQIDANFGFTAAVLEMLVFSKPGVVHLLPALPGKWKQGAVRNIQTRAGVSVDVRWDMTAGTMNVQLTSRDAQTLAVRLPRPAGQIRGSANIRSQMGEYVIQVTFNAAEIVQFTVQLA